MMYFNPYVGRSPNLSLIFRPWAVGYNPWYWAEIVIWPNFNTVDPTSKIFLFSESLEKDLSNDVF